MPGSPAKKDDAGRHGNIEGRDPARHWNSDERIAVALDKIVQAFSFSPENEYRAIRPLHRIERHVSLFIQPVNDVTLIFQGAERLADIHRPHHRQVLKRSGSRFGDSFRQSGRPAFGNDHSARARGVRRADYRAQVMRVFHSIEHDEKSGLPGDNCFEVGIFLLRSERDYTLMRLHARQAIQRAPIFEPDRRTGGTGKVDHFLETMPAGAAGYKDALERPFCP